MSRPVKYRVWDKTRNEMLFFDGIFNSRPYTETSTFPQYESFPQYHDLEIDQFVGLQDKNGVDIYTDDVLKSGRTGLHYHVKWADEEAAFTSLCTDPNKDFSMHPYSWEDAERIGNIHESPELLK